MLFATFVLSLCCGVFSFICISVFVGSLLFGSMACGFAVSFRLFCFCQVPVVICSMCVLFCFPMDLEFGCCAMSVVSLVWLDLIVCF